MLAGLLAVLIVLGSALLWMGVPVAGLWLSARVTGDPLGAVLFALLAIPVTMVAFGWLLSRVNARYEALRGGAPFVGRRPPGGPAWARSAPASAGARAGGRCSTSR